MKYLVNSPLKHNGKRIEAGSNVDLEPEAAKALLAEKIIVEAPAEPAKKKEK